MVLLFTALSPDFTTFYCGFEETNLCHFTQDRHENGDWTRRTQSASSQTGPRTDHTYGNRHGRCCYNIIFQLKENCPPPPVVFNRNVSAVVSDASISRFAL